MFRTIFIGFFAWRMYHRNLTNKSSAEEMPHPVVSIIPYNSCYEINLVKNENDDNLHVIFILENKMECESLMRIIKNKYHGMTNRSIEENGLYRVDWFVNISLDINQYNSQLIAKLQKVLKAFDNVDYTCWWSDIEWIHQSLNDP